MSSKRKIANRNHQVRQRIESGFESFNKWKTGKQSFRIDLAFQDFRYKELSNFNFAAVKFKKADFTGAVLKNVDFSGANLNEANFTDADLTGCNFRQARLKGANFSSAKINNANFYATIREEWILKDVKCDKCWITREKSQNNDNPEIFEPKEFEFLYGCFTVKVKFPGGFQPIDLIALPFHAKRIQEQFSNKKIIFSGLKKGKESFLEFRVDDSDKLIESEVNTFFKKESTSIRDEVTQHMSYLVNQKDSIINSQKEIIETYKHLLSSNTKPNLQIFQEIQGNNYNFGEYHGVWQEINNNNQVDDLKVEIERIQLELSSNHKENLELVKHLKNSNKEIENGNGEKALKTIKMIGKEIYDVSKKVGTTIISSYLKAELGL